MNEVRALLDELMAGAHQGRTASRDIAEAYVDSLADLDRFGPGFAEHEVRGLAIIGAQQKARNWRRRLTRTARTAKGTAVELPRFVSVRREGRTHVKGIDNLTPAETAALRDRLASSRNTLSRKVRLLDDVLAAIEANDLTLAGEALARLDAA